MQPLNANEYSKQLQIVFAQPMFWPLHLTAGDGFEYGWEMVGCIQLVEDSWLEVGDQGHLPITLYSLS